MGNSDPIVLVHGFLGWGPGELGGLRYWGGPKHDIIADLRKQGFDVRVAVVGPVSSNWDRAVELYAQLTGTRADYGAAHSKKHLHLREGPAFETSLVPQWDSNHRIHLVGHSMGGTTVTMLAHLLAHGVPEELTESGTATSPLFKGGKDWVRSVTTLSTPHRGTPFADRDSDGSNYLSLIKELLLGISEIAGAVEGPGIYDFKLGQWNFARRKGESLGDYFDRAMASKASESHDLADLDLSTDGAASINRWLRTAPDVTYFSYATEKTFPLPLSGRHVPDPRMNPLLVESAKQIGRFTREIPGRPAITPDWWGNDGIVPTISQIAPEGHAVSSDGPAGRGIWNHLGVKSGWDHLNIVGLNLEIPEILGLNLIDLEPPDITAFYRELAASLAALD